MRAETLIESSTCLALAAMLVALVVSLHGVSAWRRAAYALLPLSQGIVVVFLFAAADFHGLELWVYGLVAGAGILCGAADLLMFRAVRRSEEHRLSEQRAALLAEQLQYQQEYEQQVLRDRESAKELRAKLSERLASVEGELAESREKYEEAARGAASGNGVHDVTEVTASLEHASELIKSPSGIYCEHPVVNAILLNKARDCERLGIKLTLGLEVPRDLYISNVDLCALFANTIDNAIHACEEVPEGKRFITVRARVAAGQLIFDAENSCIEGPKGTRRGKVSVTRRHGRGSGLSEHGWGLVILDDLVRRHDGELVCEEKGGVFRVSVMLGLEGGGEE